MGRPEPKRKHSPYRRKESNFSKYNRSKERKHQISVQIFLNEDEYIKIIGGTRLHSIQNIRDFLVDNALIIANKSFEEHPDILQYFFDNPNAFHPKSGNENIFKPKEIVFDIEIS